MPNLQLENFDQSETSILVMWLWTFFGLFQWWQGMFLKVPEGFQRKKISSCTETLLLPIHIFCTMYIGHGSEDAIRRLCVWRSETDMMSAWVMMACWMSVDTTLFQQIWPCHILHRQYPRHDCSGTANSWNKHYMIGINVLCSVYNPPVGYWRSAKGWCFAQFSI